MAKDKFLIIGFGRFGESLLDTLLANKSEVMIIDNNPEKIKKVQSKVENAIIADATNETVMKKFGLKEFDAAIVAMDENFEKSLLITVILKDLGIKKIIARASNNIEEHILKKVGCDVVVFPEVEMGEKIGHLLLRKNALDAFAISDEASIIDIKNPKILVGGKLKDIKVREKYHVNIFAVKRNDKLIIPDGDYAIEEDDNLLIVGKNKDLDKFIKIVN